MTQTTSTDTQPGGASTALPQQIAHYQVMAKIGEGGMGEVYRARDTRLNRDVALKVLPRSFAEDPLRMARFEREAQLLASLNHPKIAAIYGLEESGATRALVMELVEGPTLAERIGRTPASARAKAASDSPAQTGAAGSGAKSGERTTASRSGSAGTARRNAIPVDEALPIAQQIAEALEYAHEHGVIHRDLKPANVKVTADGDVKVLDFGLAKALGPDDASGDMANSPTLSLAMTEAGMIIGTAAYMAPEQAKGKRVDRRADIWAFGCVLYEMLAGQKAFEGETVSDVLAAVIMKDPDWSALPETVPPAIQRLVRRCLQKDPRQRLQAIGDARIAIEETLSGDMVNNLSDPAAAVQPTGLQKPLRRLLYLAVTLTAILTAGLGIVAAHWMLWPTKPEPAVRFTIAPPGNAELAANEAETMSISPDGRMLAFAASAGSGKPFQLWLRPLDSLTSEPIEGTDGANMPFWSPDSRQIVFASGGTLKTVPVSGGPAKTICEQRGLGATWNSDGVILFSSGGKIFRVSEAGGAPMPVAEPEAPSLSYRLPEFLPDGRHFLFLATPIGLADYHSAAGGKVEVGSLDSRKTEILLEGSSEALYAKPGYLFYAQGGTLMARPFNSRSLKFAGQAIPIAGNVRASGSIWVPFSVSDNGVLVYRTGAATMQVQMTWFDRKGQKVGTVGQPGIYGDPEISPDGSRLAVTAGSSDSSASDVWIYDLKRGTGSRLTFTSAQNSNPQWTGDGSRIFFSSYSNGKYGIYDKRSDGLGNAQLDFQPSKQAVNLDALSRDGHYALYMSQTPRQNEWALPLTGDGKPFPFFPGNFITERSQVSPNGRYIAYVSWETGRPEVYVQTFPQHLGKWQISVAGGNEPMWRSDGKELFYRDPDSEIMDVDVTTSSGEFQASEPKPLFKEDLAHVAYWRNSYAVSPDGQRFLMLEPASGDKPEPITLVMNWPALLKK